MRRRVRMTDEKTLMRFKNKIVVPWRFAKTLHGQNPKALSPAETIHR
jgi:hypothetical protein